MESLLIIFRDICLPILLLIFAGWGIDRKFRLDLTTLVKLNLYVFVPAFIFVKVSTSPLAGDDAARLVLFTLGVIATMFVASSLVSFIRRDSKSERMSLSLATMFYNSGNWGIPLMAFAFPKLGPVVQVFVLMTMNISTFSLGILLASSSAQPLQEPRAPHLSRWRRLLPLLRQPSIYAIVSALALRSVGNPLHSVAWIWTPLEYLAGALVAFALLTLGVQLSQTRPPTIGWRLGSALGIRLLLGPLAALALTRVFGFQGEMAAILIVGAASPTAVNTALLAHEFKGDSGFVSAVVFYSTLFAGLVATGLLAVLR
ncbi:MAG: AEC family transporter [Verrucomicrobiales bacterium]|nr:AEC family transporter [Verrucomicrobiales bacterium]